MLILAGPGCSVFFCVCRFPIVQMNVFTLNSVEECDGDRSYFTSSNCRCSVSEDSTNGDYGLNHLSIITEANKTCGH